MNQEKKVWAGVKTGTTAVYDNTTRKLAVEFLVFQVEVFQLDNKGSLYGLERGIFKRSEDEGHGS